MPFAEALLALVAVNLLIVAVQAVFLWLAARWFSIPGLGYRRAFAACLLIGLVCLAVGAAGAVAGLRLEEMSLGAPDPVWSRVATALPLVIFAGQIILAWLGVKWLVGGWWDQAGLAALVMLVAGFVAASIFNGTTKALLFESYSVPRAAMAPTVLGVHTDLTCPNCNSTYPFHMGDRLQGPRWSPRSPKPTVCLNCGQEAKVPAGAPIQLGDTLLVDKLVRASRWDLLLWRHRREPGTPERLYVKRLVALPGETVELLGGDVFIDGRRLRKEPFMAPEMWLPVHDTRFVPARPRPDGPHWAPESGATWSLAAGKWIAKAGQTPAVLRFAGRIADDLAYNDHDTRDAPSPRLGDVKLDCWIDEFSGKGSLGFQWEFRGLRAEATVSANGDVELVGRAPPHDGSSEPRPATARGHLAGGLPAGQVLSFAFRDGQAYLEQAGAVVASLPLGPEDVQAAKSPANRAVGPCRISLVVKQASATVSRLVLWRDVYYRSLDEMPGSPLGSGWGSTNQPLTLTQGSYYLLADNSVRAQDSRTLGPVRSKSLVGVCRWIYWPWARWHEFR